MHDPTPIGRSVFSRMRLWSMCGPLRARAAGLLRRYTRWAAECATCRGMRCYMGDFGPKYESGRGQHYRPQATLLLLRHTRHLEHWRAVGAHYGPTQIYGPTGYRPCHWRDCTAGTPEVIYCSYHRRAASLYTLSEYCGPGVAAGGWTSLPPPPSATT